MHPTRKSKAKGNAQQFWNKEYAHGGHLALSTDPSEDLVKFCRWMEREFGKKFLNPVASILDLGCGNGRNLIALSEQYGMHGTGIDISNEAIAQARKNAGTSPVTFRVEPLDKKITLPDASQTIVLDMMVSHILNTDQRKTLLAEIVRVLRPDGWLFFKTFLLEGDLHARRLLRNNASDEPGTYVHPVIGTKEHVFTEDEIVELLSPHFYIHKMTTSHHYQRDGHAHKRRSICVYAQKN